MPDAPVIPLHPKGRKCGAQTRSKTKCRREAGWGTDHVGHGRCKLHGGSTPVGKRNAAMEGAREALADFKATVPFYGNGGPNDTPMHPFEVILDNVNRSQRAVQWLEGIIQGWAVPDFAGSDSPNPQTTDQAVADQVNDEGGAPQEWSSDLPDITPAHGRPWSASYALPDSERTGLGVPLQTVSVYGKGGAVHDSEYLAFLRLYQDERRAAVSYAKIALDAGLDERMARLNESSGLHMRKIIEGTLARLGVTTTDDVAAIVLEEIRALNRRMIEGEGA